MTIVNNHVPLSKIDLQREKVQEMAAGVKRSDEKCNTTIGHTSQDIETSTVTSAERM